MTSDWEHAETEQNPLEKTLSEIMHWRYGRFVEVIKNMYGEYWKNRTNRMDAPSRDEFIASKFEEAVHNLRLLEKESLEDLPEEEELCDFCLDELGEILGDEYTPKTCDKLEIRHKYHALINHARNDLQGGFDSGRLRPTLKHLIDAIVSEKPDYVVFLDKRARIFGSPVHKYLKQLGLEKMPQVRFYNDDLLKTIYNDDLLKTISTDTKRFKAAATKGLKDFLGKKTFFVDEYCFTGLGAETIVGACKATGNPDLHYFALSSRGVKLPNNANLHTPQVCYFTEHYYEPFPCNELTLYVKDEVGSNITRFKRPEESDRYAVIKCIKDMIYQTLMELPR